MNGFTRLTVVGSLRRAEVVVPDDEALGGLLPRLMELLEEPTGPVARPLALVRLTGEQVDAGLTAAEQRLGDGELLRLLRHEDSPPPPEVADVTDVVGDSYADRDGLWSAVARHSLAAVTIGAGSGLALLVHPLSAAIGIAVLALLCLVGVIAGRAGRLGLTGGRWLTIACTAAAAGAAVPVARVLVGRAVPAGLTAGSERWLWAAGAAVLVWVVLGVGVGVGLGVQPAVPGALLGAVLIVLPLALAAAGLRGDRAASIGLVAAVVVCGLLPWYALSASGLTGLDDQVLAGRPSRRPQVLLTVTAAYRTLSWSTVAVALPLAGTAAVLVSSTNRWTVVLGLVGITVTALRTRSFPLIVQQFALGLAAGAAAAVAVLAHRPAFTAQHIAALLIAAVIVVAIGAGVRPAEHHRARLRRLGNLIEALAVISLAPLLLGSFGLFTELIGKFR